MIMDHKGNVTIKQLLLVDDDDIFCEVLSRALTKRGYEVHRAGSVEEADVLLSEIVPDYAVVDLRMPGSSGLTLIPRLCELNERIRIVVLTGYASIATAVEAIKLGAIHYLTKPADADEIVESFYRDSGDTKLKVAEKPIPLNRIEWEYIQKVIADCNGNISEAARRLGMHRRTLQRKLHKRPSKLN
jgi:two-component system response regulator RegA